MTTSAKENKFITSVNASRRATPRLCCFAQQVENQAANPVRSEQQTRRDAFSGFAEERAACLLFSSLSCCGWTDLAVGHGGRVCNVLEQECPASLSRSVVGTGGEWRLGERAVSNHHEIITRRHCRAPLSTTSQQLRCRPRRHCGSRARRRCYVSSGILPPGRR